jgi:hypothetical protein
MCCKNCKNEVCGCGGAAAALPQRGKKRVRTKLTSFTTFFFSLRILIEL